MSAATWIWDTTHSLYYSPESGVYAYTDPSGAWHYLPASSLASSSTTPAQAATTSAEAAGDKEDGEIEDDVGWGGLMDPEELDKALKSKAKVKAKAKAFPSASASASNPSSTIDLLQEKHPAYSNPYSRPTSPSPPAEPPNHFLRLVVIASPSLTPGHVAIIDTREGGVQLGRDRPEKGGHPRIRVKEMEVSKSHAVIYWGEGADDEEGWWAVDLGSTHGTFISSEPAVSKHRLSISKSSSLPYPISHLSTLTLGQTTFELHNHPQWPCDECQLGASRDNEISIDTGEPPVMIQDPQVKTQEQGATGWAMNSSEKRENREVKRKREMAALKDSLLNRHPSGEDNGEKREYLDRSAIRRRLHPKSPPNAKSTSNRPELSPPPQASSGPVLTFAQNMLTAQGWAPGSGLGKDRDGRSEAVQVKLRVEKRGLGAAGAEKPVEEEGGGADEGDWRKKGRSRRFEEVREW